MLESQMIFFEKGSLKIFVVRFFGYEIGKGHAREGVFDRALELFPDVFGLAVGEDGAGREGAREGGAGGFLEAAIESFENIP